MRLNKEKEYIQLETMSEFFNKRSEKYDTQQIINIGGDACYKEIAKYVPQSTKKCIDIGCGTGLELEAIYQKIPFVKMIGVDMAKSMLEKCYEKYKDRNIELVEQNYFDYNFGIETFDTAISVMTLHHFKQEEKINLYHKIFDGLKKSGVYIECDYMVEEQKQEEYYSQEYERIKKENKLSDGMFHFDTPCTIDNQISMLKRAGFQSVDKVWQHGTTVIMLAQKE